MKPIARWIVSRALEVLCRITPKDRHVVVAAFPDDEGNAMEVVRALVAHYRGRVHWLIDEPEHWRTTDDFRAVRTVRKSSLRGMLSYATAEAIFFTHGLYGDCRPSRRQTVVNLWHGDGFKQMPETPGRRWSTHPADVVVGGTRLLTERKALDFRMDPEAALVTGNPRVDQFGHRPPDELLERVAGPAGAPFVLWLPTFRSSTGSGTTAAWSDVSEHDDTGINAGMQSIVDVLARHGVRVVVKPHPMDSDARSVEGAVVIDDGDLRRYGTTLYALLGAASGLVTDYSSVWTDYLVLDRPIAFFVPDEADYVATRGIYPADGFDWLPGLRLDSDEAVSRFAAEVTSGAPSTAPLRARTADWLGLARPDGRPVARRLLTEVERRGGFSRSGGLRTVPAATSSSPVIRRRASPQRPHGRG